MRRLIQPLLIVLVFFGLVGFTGRAEADDSVLVASSGRHVFVVRPATEGQGWELAHLDVEVGSAGIRTIHRLSSRPEAIAADGERCWLVLPPRDADRITRLVISIGVARHPINGVWYATPPGNPRVLPPVPTEPEVAGITAGRDEVLLVFRPSQRGVRGVSRPDRPAPAAEKSEVVPTDPVKTKKRRPSVIPEIDVDQGGVVRFARPGGRVWEAIATPDGFEQASEVLTGRVDHRSNRSPAIAWRTVNGLWQESRFDSEGGPTWKSMEIVGVTGTPFALEAIPGRTMLAARTDDGLVVSDLIPEVPSDPAEAALQGDSESGVTLRTLARIPKGKPAGLRGAGMVLTNSGPWLVGVAGEAVEIVSIDRADGRIADPVVAVEVEAEGSLVQYPIIGIVMMSAFMAAFLLRPGIEKASAIPDPGLAPLGFARRAAGLCLDLAPGAMAIVVIYGLEPAAFLSDVLEGRLTTASPLLAMVLIATSLSGVLEVLTGRSIGKWLVGGRILALDGSPATRLQRGLRAVLKLAVLLFWPLAIFGLFEPLGRGIPELLTRTVVTSGHQVADEPEDSDAK